MKENLLPKPSNVAKSGHTVNHASSTTGDKRETEIVEAAHGQDLKISVSVCERERERELEIKKHLTKQKVVVPERQIE